jgi:hypothetical protein
MGAAFAFTEATVANQRQKDDAINGVTGGCAAGFLAGIRGWFVSLLCSSLCYNIVSLARSLPLALSSCVLVGAAVGTFDYAGSLSGDPSESRSARQRRFLKHPRTVVETSE